MKRFLRYALILILLCGILAWWGSKTNSGTIQIAAGDTVSAVGNKLERAKIIKSVFIFRVAYKVFGGSAHVYPGAIDIRGTCSLRCVIHEVTSPDARLVRITFKEGEDLRDLARLLTEKIPAHVSEFTKLVGVPAHIPTTHADYANDFIFLKDVPKNISIEGYLFPDSYDVAPTAGVDQLVRVMLRNFDRKFTLDMRNRAAAQHHSIHEIVTMASILEKEVRGTEDRRLVADLLWRRIGKGIGLQVDSSVNYASGNENRFTSAVDRAQASLWNTYKYKDLPVGPIGNPGSDALESALNPAPNDNWFYLTSPDGAVHYARTLEGHIVNKKYLK